MSNIQVVVIHDVDILVQLKKFKLGEVSLNIDKNKSLLRDFKAAILSVKEFLAGQDPFVWGHEKRGELLESIDGSMAFADTVDVELWANYKCSLSSYLECGEKL
mmetsp:Transcript_10975/g.14485  ORF Transcript_10975/g.14485 Transcript_10975/m.14485 type:complete len:104 (-) Transcript_10975:27-338(-)